MADTAERQFQQDIIDGLQANGWLVGEPGAFDRAHALHPVTTGSEKVGG